jgi:hypothetical protein
MRRLHPEVRAVAISLSLPPLATSSGACVCVRGVRVPMTCVQLWSEVRSSHGSLVGLNVFTERSLRVRLYIFAEPFFRARGARSMSDFAPSLPDRKPQRTSSSPRAGHSLACDRSSPNESHRNVARTDARDGRGCGSRRSRPSEFSTIPSCPIGRHRMSRITLAEDVTWLAIPIAGVFDTFVRPLVHPPMRSPSSW